MNKSLSNKKRAMSASLYSDKKQNGINPKIQQKRFGRTFTESYDGGEHVSKGSKARLYTSVGEHFNKVNEKIGKAPQQLAEQNFLLKNQLKDLNTKLYLTKSKIESQKKKHLIYAKKLNRQFEKELYWQNEKQNQYLITGIKSQYEKLKQSYQQKCQQFQQLKNTISSTQMQEMILYCEALEEQNKILLQNITFLKKNKKRSTNLENYLSPVTKLNSQDIEYILNDYRQKQIRYKNKIKKLQQEMYQRVNKESQLIKKINFLQKLIIDKQNDSHHCRMKVKAVQKQKTKLIKEIKIIQEKIVQKEKTNSMSIEELKAQNQRQSKIEKAMFEKVIKQKNIMIQKLEKQIGYLSTLLTHWKPLDQLDRFDRNDLNSSSQKDRASSIHNQSVHLHGAPSRQMLNRTKTPMNLVFPEESSNEERFLLKSTHNQEFLNKDLSLVSLNREEQTNRLDEHSNREPRRSSKKWTEEAKKCRKVLQNQIEHLGELIKFKMIAHQKSLNEMKEFFSCKLQRSNSSKLQQELITMKQAKETLMSEPFNLSQEEANLLSRYIIEDQGSQFVFCHQGNQNERAIVKSIMKNIVGDYALPDYESCQTKWKDIKRIYCHNMQLVLKSVCPKGIITKDKFLEIFRSLGIDIEESTKNYLIGKLVEQQNSLSNLKYDILFSPEQRIE